MRMKAEETGPRRSVQVRSMNNSTGSKATVLIAAVTGTRHASCDCPSEKAKGGKNGKSKGKGKPKGKGGPKRDNKAKSFQSGPAKKDRIDPDNPFAAALMGLKK